MGVWSTDERKIKVVVASETIEVNAPVTADEVKRIARAHGVIRFTVEKDGVPLNPEDFPIEDGTIVIKEYTEAK